MKGNDIIIVVLSICLIVTIAIFGFHKQPKKVEEEPKMEYNEVKMKENMKLFQAPKGWIVIYEQSLAYVPDEEHIWELAKKGKNDNEKK